jgi:hypothetical protein
VTVPCALNGCFLGGVLGKTGLDFTLPVHQNGSSEILSHLTVGFWKSILLPQYHKQSKRKAGRRYESLLEFVEAVFMYLRVSDFHDGRRLL